MCNYQEVLQRLTEYRKISGMTQEQLGARIELSQEQYSYLENGITRITDKNLKAFFDMGWDIDYLITGKRFDYDVMVYDYEFNCFMKDKDVFFHTKLPAELIAERVCRYDGINRSRFNMGDIDLLVGMLKSWDNFLMLRFVRERLKISQIDMAERIGIGIKKYREIEREIRYPDAEILLDFYEMSGYRPTLFMNFYDRKQMMINVMWQKLGTEERKCLKG